MYDKLRRPGCVLIPTDNMQRYVVNLDRVEAPVKITHAHNS